MSPAFWSQSKNWWMNILGRVIAAGIVGGLYWLLTWLRANWSLLMGFLEGGGR